MNVKNKKPYLLLFVCLLFSCQNNREQKAEDTKEKVQLTKLERLMLLPRDSVIAYYDLSNDSIETFPDLSAYTIRSLNLSHNKLDTILVDYLPKDIRTLDLSYNRLRYLYNEIDSLSPIFLPPTLSKLDLSHNRLERFFIIWRENEALSLSELNLSNNKLECVVIPCIPVRKIDASNNDLTGVSLYSKDIKYVDISNNPQLSNRVGFDPSKVDTIIRNNIENDKPLEDATKMRFPIIISSVFTKLHHKMI